MRLDRICMLDVLSHRPARMHNWMWWWGCHSKLKYWIIKELIFILCFFWFALRLLPDRMRSGAWMVAIVFKTFGVWPSECLNNETPIGIGVLGRWWSICRHCAIHAFRSTNTQSEWFMIHFVSNVSNHCQSDKPSCYTSPREWRSSFKQIQQTALNSTRERPLKSSSAINPIRSSDSIVVATSTIDSIRIHWLG